MKKFICNVALFALIVVAAIAIVEVALYTVPNIYSIKRRHLERHGDDVRTLIMGQSQPYYGLDPTVMGDSIYNVAIPGMNYYYNYRILERYITAMPNLRCVVLPIYTGLYNLNSVVTFHSNPTTLIHVSKMHKYFGIPSTDAWTNILCSTDIMWGNDECPTLLRFFDTPELCNDAGYGSLSRSRGFTDIHKAGKPTNDGCEADVSINGRESADGADGRSADNSVPYFYSERMEATTISEIGYARAIGQLCHDNGVRLVLVRFPVYIPDSSLYIEEELDLRYMQRCIDQIRSACPDARYYDYSAEHRLDIGDFHDNTHLNECGAAKFSAIVRDEVLASAI